MAPQDRDDDDPVTLDTAMPTTSAPETVPLWFAQFDVENPAYSGDDAQRDASDELTVRIELGRARMSQHDVALLQAGGLVQLNRLTEEPLDIRVGSRLIARGEVVVIDGKLGVRIVQRIVDTVAGEKAA